MVSATELGRHELLHSHRGFLFCSCSDSCSLLVLPLGLLLVTSRDPAFPHSHSHSFFPGCGAWLDMLGLQLLACGWLQHLGLACTSRRITPEAHPSQRSYWRLHSPRRLQDHSHLLLDSEHAPDEWTVYVPALCAQMYSLAAASYIYPQR